MQTLILNTFYTEILDCKWLTDYTVGFVTRPSKTLDEAKTDKEISAQKGLEAIAAQQAKMAASAAGSNTPQSVKTPTKPSGGGGGDGTPKHLPATANTNSKPSPTKSFDVDSFLPPPSADSRCDPTTKAIFLLHYVPYTQGDFTFTKFAKP